MDDEYEVMLTPYALNQMMEITQYISVALQAPVTAEKWLDMMEREIRSLSFLPARFPLTEEEPWHSQGIHKLAVRNFFVYFWIETGKHQVWVTAVVYARRDQKSQLTLMRLP